MANPAVLFLCTGNSARSQMAEAFLREYAGDSLAAHSAGTEPKGINPLTLQVMAEIGLDMSQHRSKHLSEFFGRPDVRYLITVCSEADRSCPSAWPGVHERIHWPFEDPAAFRGTDEQRLAKFRAVRDQIGARVKAWVEATLQR